MDFETFDSKDVVPGGLAPKDPLLPNSDSGKAAFSSKFSGSRLLSNEIKSRLASPKFTARPELSTKPEVSARSAFFSERVNLSSSHPNAYTPYLSSEYDLLLKCGVPESVLLQACEHAFVQGVSLDEYMLAEELITETLLYYTLSQILRRPFVEYDVRLENVQAPRSQLMSGVVLVLEGGAAFRYLAAPRGRASRGLLQNRNNRRAELAITTPSHLKKLVTEQSRLALVKQASMGLWFQAPELSARGRPSKGQYAFAGGSIFMLSFLSVLDIRAALDMMSLCFSFLFFIFVLLRLLAIWVSGEHDTDTPPQTGLPDFMLPRYTIIAALYHEARVAEKLTRALAAMDYPPAKLDILIVLEEDDHETCAALSKLRLPPRFQIILAPKGNPRTKPRALNIALPYARGEYIAIYDAEDEPEPLQLRLAAAKFSSSGPDLACVQARLCVENTTDSVLSRLFSIEYAALFDVVNPGYSALGLAFPLGGTSNHFRARALRDIGGWDAWNVTEDADLGFRLCRNGYRIDTINSSTFEEAPVRLKAWLGQRKRWLKGWMQTLIVHTRNPAALVREIGLQQSVALLSTLFGTVIGALAAPAYLIFMMKVLIFGVEFERQNTLSQLIIWFGILVCAVGIGSMLWAALLGLARRDRLDQILWVAALPLYYMLVSVAAWLALIELIRNPYFWFKTEHGVSRSSAQPVQFSLDGG